VLDEWPPLAGGAFHVYLFRARALVAFLAVFLAVAFFFTERVLARVGFFATFLAGFFAAGLRATFLAVGACFRLAGAFGAAAGAAGLAGAGIMGDGMLAAGVAGLGGVIPGAAGIAGALIASSQPGVNISRRSREIALARPQRGQRAS
jgi:hypothetical protein